VGKSTFFSAITLLSVKIASRPFTTTKPNRGIGYLRTPCVCSEFNVKDDPVNSTCIDGMRLIPVEVIDCAGLVPGAWEGRGLGNWFLDEIRKADALIHLVDASGSTDEEGRPCRPGTRDPVKDIEFLEYEIAMWLKGIIKKDWTKITQRVKTKTINFTDLISNRLSGLSINKKHVSNAFKKTDLNPEKPEIWNDDDLYLFSSTLREIAKPMLIAANKIDVSHAEENVRRMEGLGYHVIPCSAEAELCLRRAGETGLIEYKPGDSDFKITSQVSLSDNQSKALKVIRSNILKKWENTGVQEVINTAFYKLLNMISVYPVENSEKLSNHEGKILPDVCLVPKGTSAKQLSFMIHTELGEGFIYAVDARKKIRLSEGYILEDKDVIKIVSAKGRT
jgi:ribosome-binding ATPase YchF (GTP1/OBG family)